MLRFLVGVIGLFELCYPRRAVSIWTRLAYENAEEAEPRDWLLTVAKAEGTLLVLLAVAWPTIRAVRGRSPTVEEADDEDPSIDTIDDETPETSTEDEDTAVDII